MKLLLDKISRRSAQIVVVGAGYVGLPLALEFAKSQFQVTALDHDEIRVKKIAAGDSYLSDLASEQLGAAVETGKLRATTEVEVLRDADVVLVCVPTPLSKSREPDTHHIIDASRQIERHQHPEMLVVLESTTYPGTTQDLFLPTLTRGGFELGKSVFVAFSPERTDPGNQHYNLRNTPKVIAGCCPLSLKVASALYENVIDTLVPVSDTKTAETVKLLENTFRAVNIGLINEIAIMARKLGVNPFEVADAAATKPFGYMPFTPGPGLGGHCIPVDPLYLSWRLKDLNYDPQFIAVADSVNRAMPNHVTNRLAECLNESRKALNGSTVLVYGAAYKPNISDTRESPALSVMHELRRRSAVVSYMDPHVPALTKERIDLRSVPEETSFSDFDAVLIATDHAAMPRDRISSEARLVLDTRNAFRGYDAPHIYTL